MALDGTELGRCASEQMEALERVYGEEEGVRVGAVMTIVEVLREEGSDEEGKTRYASDVRIRHNVGDPYRAAGLMFQAMRNILAAGPAVEE